MSNKVINPLKGTTDRSWFFEQQVYDPEGVARAIKSTDGSGNVPKIIIRMNEYKTEHIGIEESKEITFHNADEDKVAKCILAGCYKFGSATLLRQNGSTMTSVIETMADQNPIELPLGSKCKKFRIRKLTPKECFRLMDVDDKDIDKIQAAGISNSGQYKLAGNSIVVGVLFHLFRKMFIETENETQELTLF